MSAVVQILRDTKTVNDAYIGPVGTLTADTDTRSLRLHDSATAGGFRAAGAVIMDRVTTLTSHTVAIKGVETVVVWSSATAGAKTTNIPAASPANDGCKITVATTLGNGDSHTITPASGTIQGASTFTFTDDPRSAVTLVSNGTGTDWIIT